MILFYGRIGPCGSLMPDKTAHIALAKHNQDTIDYLLPEIERFSDWITTVAFYKALHLVEAVFAENPKIRHGRNHEARDNFLKHTKKYSNIWKHYRPLWAASMVARYLEDRDTGKDCGSFRDFLSPERVRAEMLNHRLRQVEKSTKKFLSR